jgi:glycosyltransferase involved in cell wall biosynthesis
VHAPYEGTRIMIVNSNKRVVFISPQILSTDHGGGIRVLEEARALSIYKNSAVSIFTYNLGGNFDEILPPSVSINRIWFTPRNFSAGPTLHRIYMDIQLALRTVSAIQLKPDVIHVHIHEGVPIGKFLSYSCNCPMVFDIQGSTVDEIVRAGSMDEGGIFHCLIRHFEYLINKTPNALISSSPILSEMITKISGIDKHKVFTVLDAVDIDVFKPMSNKAKHLQVLKRSLGIPNGDKVVIYVGTFSKLQGTDILIRSVQRVVTSIPNVTFLLIGGKWNLKYYHSMMELAQELNIKKHIVFISSADYFRELPYYLNLADIAVAPKLQSPQSHGKLAVFMAVGLPTVVFDIPINQIFLGQLGIYQEKISSESLADSIVFALERYSGDTEFKRKLRLRANKLFSLERLANDLQRIYHEPL